MVRRNVRDGAAVENTPAAPKDLLPSAALMHRHQCGGVQTNVERHHGSMGGGGNTITSRAAMPVADDAHAGVAA